ncbi:hypothetical protein V2W45_1517900 [Cenococcum geophilum]
MKLQHTNYLHSRQYGTIFDWLQSCEVDLQTTNSFQVPSPFPSPRKWIQHYKAASDGRRTLIRRLRPRSRSLPTTFMDDGDQHARRGRGGGRGVMTRSQSRKNKLEARQSSGTYPHAQTTLIPLHNTASSDPDLADNVNIDQLQLEERLSTVTSEFDLHTPTTFSRSTTFTAVANITSLSRNHTRIGDLRAAKPPIKVEAAIKVPQDVKALLDRSMDIHDGIGVLPQYTCSQAQLNALDHREYRNVFFDNSDNLVTAYDRELLEKLRLLRDAALRC